jgi:phosphatidylglycerophosphatase A
VSRARRLLASAGGLGRLPASGTWTSFATVILVLLVLGVRGSHPGLLAAAGLQPGVGERVAGLALAAAVVAIVGIVIGQHAEQDFQCKDPHAFVLDEVAGQMLALVPLAGAPLSLFGAGLGFALFRMLDILKPWPIRRLEALPGGVGIMADDLAAGALAAVGIVAAGAAGWLS